MKKLHLVDFDGTLYRGDSFIDFIRFSVGAFPAALGFAVLAPLGLMHTLGWADAEDTKRRFVNWFFGGYSEEELQTLGDEFAARQIPKKLFPKAQEQLAAWQQDPSSTVVIVSASLKLWIEPFAKAWDAEYLSTALAFSNGQYQKQFSTPNCNGNEKAKRILAHYTLGDYDRIYAYGNSRGDSAMFSLADESYMKPFQA